MVAAAQEWAPAVDWSGVAMLDFDWVPLGTLLVNAGLLTPEQRERALERKEASGRRLGEVIVDLGFATTHEIATAVAGQYDLEFVDVASIDPPPEVVARLPEELARRYDALPVRVDDDGAVVIAVSDPTNLRTVDDLRLALGGFRVAVGDPHAFAFTLDRLYRTRMQIGTSKTGESEEKTSLEEIRGVASSKPTINLVNSMLTSAVELGASDVHVEPRRDQLVVRARVDGVMRELGSVPKYMQPEVVSRLKIMAGLDIAERRAPQDGRVSVRFGGRPLDIRVAVLPTRHGEQVVLRIAGGSARPTFGDLGMSAETERELQQAIGRPYGAVIACGPTGSGKTTTLYAALDALNDRHRVVMTIEDPIEHELEGVNQIEVDPKGGLTFARGLRTILRSDPDVLLVGEVRDEETAQIAIRAAMTGHLVLTSLHVHNAAAAIVRLREMGVEPGLLASALNCIVAQRLVRRLCADCREEYVATAGSAFGELAGEQVTLYRPTGCVRCGHTGYEGRVALYEVMPVRGEIRNLMEDSTETIFAAAVRQGMRTLGEDGRRLVLDGISSVDEIARITGDRLI
jgi:type IV pilus assembly protein PilB